MLIEYLHPKLIAADQLGAADSDGASLGASLGIELSTGAADCPAGDVPEPDGEQATKAAPIAKIKRIRFNMNDLLGFRRRAVRAAGWSVLRGPPDRRWADASVVRARVGVGVACGSQSPRPSMVP